MNEYKIEFSYIRNGQRIKEIDITNNSRAADAANEILSEYSDLEKIRIEQVWIDTGKAWEKREFDY